MAFGILVPRAGIEPVPSALGAQNLSHWTPREVPGWPFQCKNGASVGGAWLQPTGPVEGSAS